MPELSCGCILLKETIWLEKEIRDDKGKLIENVRMCHDYYHLVDKTGKNKKKVELFNKGEELRMSITKRMFNILVDEEKYDVDDGDYEWNFTVRKDDDDEEVEDDDNDKNQKRTDNEDEKPIEYGKHPKSPLDGCTLAQFKKVVKVVPASESSEEEEEEEEENMTDPYNYMSPKSKAQYDRDVEKRWKEEEEKQEKRRQKCINKKTKQKTRHKINEPQQSLTP